MGREALIAKMAGNGRVLDIGFAQRPNPHLNGAVGVDIQKVACPKNYKEVHVVDLNTFKLPFKDASFDAVIIADVIEHVENPSHVLREANRVLTENGTLIVSTPHANYWWTILHNWFFTFIPDSDEGEHLANWTKLDMIRLLKCNGFATKKIHGTVMVLPVLGWQIPVGPFPMLGWVVLYHAQRVGNPKNYVLTKTKEEKYIKVSS